jgi:hypothetical protein
MSLDDIRVAFGQDCCKMPTIVFHAFEIPLLSETVSPHEFLQQVEVPFHGLSLNRKVQYLVEF